MGIKLSSRNEPTFGPPPTGGPPSSAGMQHWEPFMRKLLRWSRVALTLITIAYVFCVGFVFYMIEYDAEDHHLSALFMYLPQYIWLFPLFVLTPLCLLIYSRLVLLHMIVAGLVLFVFMDYVFKGPSDVGGVKFTVMTNNIGEDHGKKVHKFIDAEDPDVIVLQDAKGRFSEYKTEYGSTHWLHSQDQFLLVSKFPIVGGGNLELEDYQLRMLKVDSLEQLPQSGRLEVIVATVAGKLHVRIFEADSKIGLNVEGRGLVKGQDRTNLEGLVNDARFPDVPLTPEIQKAVIRAVRVAAKHRRHELAAWFEVDVRGTGVYIFAVHMPTPRDQLEAAKGFGLLGSVAHRVKKGGHADKVYLEGKAFFRYQLELANKLIDFTREADKPYIVAGDFNIPTHGKTYHAYKKAWTEVFDEVGKGYGATFPGDAPKGLPPWLRLDNIYCSRNLRPVSAMAEKGRGSQHLAMLAELALPRMAGIATR